MYINISLYNYNIFVHLTIMFNTRFFEVIQYTSNILSKDHSVIGKSCKASQHDYDLTV